MRSLWTNRRYVLWLISDTAKGLGTSLYAFAIPLVALFVTNDPAQAGVIGGVGMAVRLVTTLYGGVLADRHSRIAMMLTGALVATVLALGFLLLALGDALTFMTLLIVEVALTARSGIFESASESALKEIVPSETMGRAQAANQARDAALQLVGGPLGGMLLAVGAWLIAVTMTAAYGVAALMAAMLGPISRGSHPDADDEPSAGPAGALRRNALREMREGFAWLFARADLGGVLVMITIINLGFNTVNTTVLYGMQQAGETTLTIGWISAILGGTMLIGALVAPMLVPRVGAGILTTAGLFTTTVGSFVLIFVDGPWGIAAVLAASIFLLPALNAAMMGYFMVATPSRLLGRANSAAGVLGMGAMPLAPLIAGFGLAWLGRGWTLTFGAVVCLIALLLALGSRALRAIPAESGWAAHAAKYAVGATAGRE